MNTIVLNVPGKTALDPGETSRFLAAKLYGAGSFRWDKLPGFPKPLLRKYYPIIMFH